MLLKGISLGHKILFVDDEPLVLDSFRRVLHKEFDVDTALGGQKGLVAVQDNGPYSVVVSDMRMPGMNGAEFLAAVYEDAPDTVRMLLTGYTDLKAAMDAVNEGHIFRFLTKPIEKDALVKAINIGLVQYRLNIDNREALKDARINQTRKPDWDQAETCQWDHFQGPTGLGGPSEARAHLLPLLGADLQCYVVMLRLTVFRTIEQRYGEGAASDYLNIAAQSLMQALRSEDKLFHWGRDVLMAVMRRQLPTPSVRTELVRRTSAVREHVMEVEGRNIMIASPVTFDLLPASQFATVDGLLGAFDPSVVCKT
jgi:CheY-like chemotaxis protein